MAPALLARAIVAQLLALMTYAAPPPGPSSSCLPAHSVAFVHVMKTGGIAVDDFIACACRQGEVNCAMQRSDGSQRVEGKKACGAPSIATAHASAVAFSSGSGKWAEWEAARTFTVLRDPVSRVWSFYKYIRRWYRPYQERDLAYHLAVLNTSMHNATAPDADAIWGLRANGPSGKKKTTKDSPCVHCGHNLIDGMTRQFGASEDAARPPASAAALERAKASLLGMAGVGFTDDLAASATRALDRAAPGLLDNATLTRCRIKHAHVGEKNPSGTAELPQQPSQETAAAIQAFNPYDMALYEYAGRFTATRVN